MAMTYSGLIAAKSVETSIKYRVNYSLLPIADIMDDAQALIYSQLRVREMRKSTTYSIAVGDYSKALPTRFLDPIAFFNEYGDELRPWDERNVVKLRSYQSGVLTSGRPGVYGIFDEAVQFECKANAAGTYTLLYYERPAALSLSNETNWLTERYPNVLRSALLHFAFASRNESSMADAYLAKVVALVQAANEESDLSRRGSDFPVENT